jgi:hypothetical protein
MANKISKKRVGNTKYKRQSLLQYAFLQMKLTQIILFVVCYFSLFFWVSNNYLKSIQQIEHEVDRFILTTNADCDEETLRRIQDINGAKVAYSPFLLNPFSLVLYNFSYFDVPYLLVRKDYWSTQKFEELAKYCAKESEGKPNFDKPIMLN